METGQPTGEFKPNIYPLMYWALAFGAISGVALFLAYLLSQYITLLWFPVFLVGLVSGGYRNYKKQKEAWMKGTGVSLPVQSPMQEFKQAAGDIFTASRQMMAEQRAEDQARLQQEAEIVQPTAEDQLPDEAPTEAEQPAEPQEIPSRPQPFIAPPQNTGMVGGESQSPKPFVAPTPPTPPQNFPPQNQPPTIQ